MTSNEITGVIQGITANDYLSLPAHPTDYTVGPRTGLGREHQGAVINQGDDCDPAGGIARSPYDPHLLTGIPVGEAHARSFEPADPVFGYYLANATPLHQASAKNQQECGTLMDEKYRGSYDMLYYNSNTEDCIPYSSMTPDNLTLKYEVPTVVCCGSSGAPGFGGCEVIPEHLCIQRGGSEVNPEQCADPWIPEGGFPPNSCAAKWKPCCDPDPGVHTLPHPDGDGFYCRVTPPAVCLQGGGSVVDDCGECVALLKPCCGSTDALRCTPHTEKRCRALQGEPKNDIEECARADDMGECVPASPGAQGCCGKENGCDFPLLSAAETSACLDSGGSLVPFENCKFRCGLEDQELLAPGRSETGAVVFAPQEWDLDKHGLHSSGSADQAEKVLDLRHPGAVLGTFDTVVGSTLCDSPAPLCPTGMLRTATGFQEGIEGDSACPEGTGGQSYCRRVCNSTCPKINGSWGIRLFESDAKSSTDGNEEYEAACSYPTSVFTTEESVECFLEGGPGCDIETSENFHGFTGDENKGAREAALLAFCRIGDNFVNNRLCYNECRVGAGRIRPRFCDEEMETTCRKIRENTNLQDKDGRCACLNSAFRGGALLSLCFDANCNFGGGATYFTDQLIDALAEQEAGECTGQCTYIQNCFASGESKCEQNMQEIISVCGDQPGFSTTTWELGGVSWYFWVIGVVVLIVVFVVVLRSWKGDRSSVHHS